MHRQYLHVGTRTIAYFDTAPEAATLPVMVLVHAFPLAASMWEPQLREPPTGWRLLALDLRGFGGSSDVETSNPSMADYAVDVIDLLRELNISQAVIAGLSLGGYASFALLRQARQVVRALVLADTRATADTLEGRANRRSMLAMVDREGSSGVAREMPAKLLGRTSREHRPDLEASIRRIIKQQSPLAIRGAVVRLMERPDSTPVLSSIAVPCLVIVGDEDTVTPPDEARRMADAIPSAELVVIPQAGHLSSLEQPERFGAAISAFLSRL
jgi:3-oxoadipate enol-lactonase